MKKLKLKGNEVVHCATLKQAKKVLKIAHELGLKWCNNISHIENNDWDINKEYTVYYLHEGKTGCVEYVKEEHIIITSNEFIKRHKNKSKYKVLEDRIKLIESTYNQELSVLNTQLSKFIEDVEVLQAIVNATNDRVTIVKGEETTEETALRVFEEACKEVEETKYTLKNVQVNCIGLSKEQIKEMCNIYKINGFKKWDKIDEYPFSKHMPFLSYDEECGSKGYYYHAKQNRKHTISYDKFMELFRNKQPQIGDIVKAWDNDKSKFVYGVLQRQHSQGGFMFKVGDTNYKNIEKVTEISVKDFNK